MRTPHFSKHNDFVLRLKKQMCRKNLTANELARRTGISSSFIHDILSLRSCNPSVWKVLMIADVLAVSIEYLLRGKR